MTLARGEREWALLVSEYNICKKKLESKRQALKILMGDLESCQRERDIYKNKIKQMQQDLDNFKKKEKEQERKEITGVKSPTGQTARSPEHTKFKRERKLSGHSIWEQELQSVRDRKNKTLSQLLCEAREENKALKNDFMDLRVLYREAQEDIILLRENVARQKTSDKETGKLEDLEARQGLIQHLEKSQEKLEELDREVKSITDEKNEITIERDHYREKVERLNTQLNFILGADDRRLVDIDAILMENRYQKEQIKQLKEELRIANTSLARQKASMEKKKARLMKAGYNYNPTAFMGTGVKQALPSLISEISSSFGGGVSSSTLNDLQSLANSLSESLSEKDIALLHQKNTNRILGHRVTELENKLKTLEVSGLWSLEGHRGYGSEEMAKLHLEKLKKSPHNSMVESENTPTTDLNSETEIPSAESSPDIENMDSVFFPNHSEHFNGDQDELVDVSSPISMSEEEGELGESRDSESFEDEVYHCGMLDGQQEEESSSNGDFQAKGDSLSTKVALEKSKTKEDSLASIDSQEKGDSLVNSNFSASDYQTKGDSPVNGSQAKRDSLVNADCCVKEEQTKGNSPANGSQAKGDSLVNADCSVKEEQTKGDSPVNGSQAKGDSLVNADCSVKEQTKGDSPANGSQAKGDSLVNADCSVKEQTKGDSPANGSQAKGDSLVNADCSVKEEQAKGDSHYSVIYSSPKKESTSNGDTGSENSTVHIDANFINNNNPSHCKDILSERKMTSAEENNSEIIKGELNSDSEAEESPQDQEEKLEGDAQSSQLDNDRSTSEEHSHQSKDSSHENKN